MLPLFGCCVKIFFRINEIALQLFNFFVCERGQFLTVFPDPILASLCLRWIHTETKQFVVYPGSTYYCAIRFCLCSKTVSNITFPVPFVFPFIIPLHDSIAMYITLGIIAWVAFVFARGHIITKTMDPLILPPSLIESPILPFLLAEALLFAFKKGSFVMIT